MFSSSMSSLSTRTDTSALRLPDASPGAVRSGSGVVASTIKSVSTAQCGLTAAPDTAVRCKWSNPLLHWVLLSLQAGLQRRRRHTPSGSCSAYWPGMARTRRLASVGFWRAAAAAISALALSRCLLLDFTASSTSSTVGISHRGTPLRSAVTGQA